MMKLCGKISWIGCKNKSGFQHYINMLNIFLTQA